MISGNGGSIRRKEVGTATNAEVDLKFVRAMIMVLLGGAALWIEYGHRTATDAPTSTELDALAAARACPDSENMPYTATCLAFLNGSAAPERRANAPERGAVEQRSATRALESSPVAPRSACGDTDAVPYTLNCIAFMSGWFWRPNAP
jgi:hypothetical protein